MENEQPLVFQTEVAKNKPENIVHTDHVCPFCDVPHLTDILDQAGEKIWLVNKFRTLQHTWQTVVIESAKHDGDFSNYSLTESRQIIEFALAKWQETQQNPKFKSVLMYKNFGPLSGGSLAHPHLQIVGLEQQDGYRQISPENLRGHLCWQTDSVQVRLADQPVMGFVEFNIRQRGQDFVPVFADAISTTVRYVLEDYFQGRCNSYNLFFYLDGEDVVAKVVPRFVVSPYFVGYKLAQVNNADRLSTISADLVKRLNGLSK